MLPTNPTRLARSAAVFAETKRALGVDEEPYSRTATTPDDEIAPVSLPCLVSSDCWTRTSDPAINSRLLYQLS
jgi:hypothetical protein